MSLVLFHVFLFASDGSLLLAYDKAKVLHQLEQLAENSNHDMELVTQEPSCLENSTYQAIFNDGANHNTAIFDKQDTELSDHSSIKNTEESSPQINSQTGATFHLRIMPIHKDIIIDGMALVNKMTKTDQMKTCSDFAKLFIERLINIAAAYSEVKLVFDRYIKNPLKETLRQRMTKGKSTYYIGKDSTSIQHISLKDFLSNVKIKDELTQ